MHRLAQQGERPSDIQQIMESIETLLTDLKEQMASMKKNCNLNDAMSTTRDALTSSINSSISNLKKDVNQSLTNINNDICQLNQRSIESAATCTMHNNPLLEIDIIGELKILSSNVDELKAKIVPVPTLPDSLPSLEYELDLVNADSSGWRLLGTTRIWKSDWSEYDERKKRRLQQQKMADAAKIRRNQRKRAYNFNSHNRNNHNYNKNRHQNRNLNFNCNNYQNFNQTNLRNNNNHNNNNNNHNRNSNNNNYIQLPTDRELLAAAKDQFSRPPPSHRQIHFQRGEILNPYPTRAASTVSTHIAPRSFNLTPYGTSSVPVCSSSSVPVHEPVAVPTTSSAPCLACTCRHSCFARN